MCQVVPGDLRQFKGEILRDYVPPLEVMSFAEVDHYRGKVVLPSFNLEHCVHFQLSFSQGVRSRVRERGVSSRRVAGAGEHRLII